MNNAAFIQELKTTLPESAWSWVLSSLRQDRVVWQSLKDKTLRNAFIKFSSNDPTRWSPVALALVANQEQDLLATLQKTPLQPVKDKLRHLSAHALEDFIRTGKISSSAQDSVGQCGLIALSLRESKRLVGTWEDVIAQIQSYSTKLWETPIACLYGMLPNSNGLITTLLAPSAPKEQVLLGLHALLSNPIPPGKLADDIFGHISHHSLKEKLTILRHLSNQRPIIAKLLANHIITDSQFGDGFTPQDWDQVHTVLQQAEVLQFGGKHADAMPLLTAAWSASQCLHAELTAKLAHSAAKENDSETAMAALTHAENIHSSSSEVSASITLARIGTGQIISKSKRKSRSDSDGTQYHPAEMLSTAKMLQASGNINEAQMIARQALDTIETLQGQKKNNSQLPCEIEVAKILNFLKPLSELFLELNMPSEAARSSELALSVYPNDVDMLCKLSKANLELGQYQKAISNAHIAVALSSERIDLRRMLVKTLMADTNWKEAFYEIDNIMERQPAPESGDLYNLAICCLNLDDPARAAQACQQALHNAPEEGKIHILLGKALLQLGDPSTAINHFEKATIFSPQMPDAWLYLSDSYLDSKENEKAIETLKRGIKTIPETPDLFLALGKIHYQEKKHSQALPFLQQADELLSKSHYQSINLLQETALYVGMTLQALGDLDAACQRLAHANQAFPANLPLVHAYARVLLDLGKARDALSALITVVHDHPHNIELQLDYARAHLILREKPEEAIQALQIILNDQPDNTQALALLAEASAQNNDLEYALEIYHQVMESDLANDSQWSVQLNLGFGKTALLAGKNDIAIACLQEARQLEPENKDVLQTLSDAYINVSLPQESLQIAKEVYQLSPDDPETLLWYSEQTRKLDHTKEAEKALKRAAQLSPNDSKILNKLGYLYLQADDYDAARSTFHKIYLSSTARAEDLRSAAIAMVSMGENTNSVIYLERALELSPEPPVDLLKELTTARCEAGDYEAALDSIDKNLVITPGDTGLLIAKADLLLKLERPQAALATLEHALKIAPQNPQIHYGAALILRSSSDLSCALDHAEQALCLAPEDFRIRYLVAETARAGLRENLARKILEEGETYKKDIEKQLPTYKSEYFDCLCIQAELALDDAEEVHAANLIADAVNFTNDSPVLMALQARLANHYGNSSQALQIFNQALETLTSDRSQDHSAHQLSNVYLSIAQAAFDLKLYDSALDMISSAIEKSRQEPRPHLILAQALLLRAEYQWVCDAASATKHAPGTQSISEKVQNKFKYAVDAAQRTAPFKDTHIKIQSLKARGNDIFTPHITNRDRPANYPQSSEEAAAYISAKNRIGEHVDIDKLDKELLNSPQVKVQMAIALAGTNVSNSLHYICELIETHPDNPLYRALAAQLEYKNAEYDSALNNIKIALGIWSDEPRWHALLADVYHAMEDTTNAITQLEIAVKLEDNYLPHYIALGKAYLLENAPGNAIRVFEKAIDISQHNPDIWLLLAKAHKEANNLNRAEQCAEQAVKSSPRDPVPLILRAQIALTLNQHQKAQSFAQAALHLKPNLPEGVLLLSKTLESQGATKEAIAVLDDAIDSTPEPLTLLLERAKMIRDAEGDRAQLVTLKKLLHNYPDHPIVLLELSKALKRTNQPQIAIQAAQKAIRNEGDVLNTKDQIETHFLLGKMLNAIGQLDQAVDHLSKAIDLAPNHIEAILEIGRTHQARRQYALAQDFFQQAISVSPNDPRPYWESGQSLKECKDYVGAETMLRRAANLAPKDINIQRQLGAVLALKLVHQPSEAD
jgi:tetratricopeptide (TPR) repeat protein